MRGDGMVKRVAWGVPTFFVSVSAGAGLAHEDVSLAHVQLNFVLARGTDEICMVKP